jgi:hypothetical protein
LLRGGKPSRVLKKKVSQRGKTQQKPNQEYHEY